jgi:nitrogen regulatory protein PII
MVKTSLPFEVVGDESRQESGKRIQAGLKRVEVFLGSERANDVLAAIKDKGFEATSYDSKGFGEEKGTVRTGRGTGEAQLSYSTRRTIVTIVDSNKLEEVVEAIKSASGGGGIIAISPMDAIIHMKDVK